MQIRQRRLIARPEHLPPPPPHQIAHVLRNAPQVLPYQLARRLAEQDIDLLQRLVLGLRHEEQLVEPADDGDAAVEAERQADAAHGGLHVGEEVGDEPGAEEERDVGGLHAVAAQVSGVDLGGQDPGEAGVGAEEALVEDETGDVAGLGAAGVGGGVDEVGAADDEEAEEEAGKHGAGPEAAAEALHVEDSGDGAEEEGAAADEGHEDGLFGVEAYLAHEGCHVVLSRWYVSTAGFSTAVIKGRAYHDGVDTCELPEEDHDVGVNNRSPSARHGDEVEPSERTRSRDLVVVFVLHGMLHNEEFLAILLEFGASDTFPYIERFQSAALVHEETRRFRHPKHAYQHDGGEDKRGAQHVAPATALDIHEDSSHDVAEHLSESDVELIQRDEIPTVFASDGFSDVDRDGTALETDAQAKDDTSRDDHAEVDGAGFEGAADCVEDQRDDDGHSTTDGLVGGTEEEGTTDGAEGHAGGNETDLRGVEVEGGGHVEIGAGNEGLIDAG